MKKILLIIILAYTRQFLAQEYLPLQIGNSWNLIGPALTAAVNQNSSSDIKMDQPQDTLLIKVTRDTLMSNGKKYAVLNKELGLGEYIRSDSLFIYYYDENSLTDVPVFNLKAGLNDSKEITFRRSDYNVSLIEIKNDSAYGSLPQVLKFRVKGDKEFDIAFSGLSGICEYAEPSAENKGYKLKSSVLNEEAYRSPVNAAPAQKEAMGTYKLKQDAPDPFGPIGEIRFNIPSNSHVKITIYNIHGNEVALLANGFYPAGNYRASTRYLRLPKGIYIYRLEAGDLKVTHKMMVTE